MDHRNFKEYSLDELYAALDSADEVAYPGQRAAIEDRIASLESLTFEKRNLPSADRSIDAGKSKNSTKLVGKLFGTIGPLALGLGAYGLFSEDPGGLHPIFGNRLFVASLACLGAIFMALELKIMLPIWKAERRAKEQANQ